MQTNTTQKPYEADWQIICRYLHHNGSGKLSEREYRCAWQLADGFGPRCLEQAIASDFYGDWSHFRDSSDAAQRELASYLRRVDEIGDAARGLI